MKKKILFCATVDSHFKAFHLPYLKFFKEHDWEVHVASYGNIELPYVDKKYNVHFSRSPFNKVNIKAFFELRRIMAENNYDIMHFHIPVSATLGRIAAMKYRKNGTKVFYTSHGHYYYKGAPLLSWLLYFPLEKALAYVTDCLITINEEDYQLSLNKQRGAKKIVKVHGMGVDLNRFGPVLSHEKNLLRNKHGFHKDDFILIYPAELNVNKNQKVLIETVTELKQRIPNVRLLLPGQGDMEEEYKQFAKQLDVDQNVKFLGFRKDIDELIKLSDVSVASSIREGLGLNLIEGMACGKPMVAVNNRGHRELVIEGVNGHLTAYNPVEIADKLHAIAKSKEVAKRMGEASLAAAELFSLRAAVNEMMNIYRTNVADMADLGDYIKGSVYGG
ncbi:glycosyltransferase family 4 protein [Paenibacillus aceris]|uniref:Glycosyltransferase EpsD n=1 Tax=Paenibacillus aceris TaxID=869555 RepID=A0ABS4I8Q0_9BACL|nr:glycosyltransferase family 4 protein [Paenibacillus aceris]MBP1967055.1 glycosyltransferase EpsD [Paenibacillus aceris]NHW33252.1 glycosyltransferase family 4 protein [Paenibacillus aceris]